MGLVFRVITTICTGMLGFESMLYWMVFLYAFFTNVFFLINQFHGQFNKHI